jgi:hypothetical protein
LPPKNRFRSNNRKNKDARQCNQPRVDLILTKRIDLQTCNCAWWL